MKKCKELKELIHGYIDKELLPREIKQLKKHLDSCQDCQEHVEIFTGLKKILKERISFISAPLSLKERILKSQIKRKPLRFVFLFPRLAAAFILIILVLSGIMLYQHKIRSSHFLILQSDRKLQKHLDNCANCQKESGKIIKEHVENIYLVKTQMEDHLGNCFDCKERIVKMIKNCMDCKVKMTWNLPEKSSLTL